MKNLKYFENFEPMDNRWDIMNKSEIIPYMNENIIGDFARLRPGSREGTKNKLAGRKGDDNYAVEIYNDMVNDFEENGRDLRKVLIVDNTRMSYIFGEFHPVENSIMSGNIGDNGKKKITVTYVSGELLLKRDELEKAFGVSRGLKMSKGRIKIEEDYPNPRHDPDFHPNLWGTKLTQTEKERYRRFNHKSEEFKITYDLAKSFINYFIKEYNKQYPELKKSKYKNEMSIRELDKTGRVKIGYVDVFDKEHNEIVYEYFSKKEKKKLEKYIKDHICFNIKSKEGYPTTYFTNNNETKEEVDNMVKNMTKEEIKKQNMERVLSY